VGKKLDLFYLDFQDGPSSEQVATLLKMVDDRFCVSVNLFRASLCYTQDVLAQWK
jgi:hypothetical protein